MSNGYFLADTNSLVYTYRAGGPKLLDANAISRGQVHLKSDPDPVCLG